MTQEEINEQIEHYQNKLAGLNSRITELSDKDDLTECEKAEFETIIEHVEMIIEHIDNLLDLL